MVVSSCVRLIVRKLALRKGVAVSVVCLTLLGAILLYHQYSRDDRPSGVSLNVRKVPVVC